MKEKKPYSIYLCDKFRCEYWDSDQNGGHCMCLYPPCKEESKEKPPEDWVYRLSVALDSITSWECSTYGYDEEVEFAAEYIKTHKKEPLG